MNHYQDKTKLQLIEEIESLKKTIEELKQSEFKWTINCVKEIKFIGVYIHMIVFENIFKSFGKSKARIGSSNARVVR